MAWGEIIVEGLKYIGQNDAMSGSGGYWDNYTDGTLWGQDAWTANVDALKESFEGFGELDYIPYSSTQNDFDLNVSTGGWYGAIKSAKQQREKDRYNRRLTGVKQAFTTALGREPTNEELAYYEDKVNRGEYTSPQEIVTALRNTDEYRQRQQDIYKTAYGSAGEGLSDYISSLQSRDYTGVIPKSVQSPLGAYGRTAEGTLLFQEAPEMTAKRGADVDMYLRTLGSIGITGDAVAAQIEETTNAFMQDILRQSMPAYSQEVIGRGLRGSSLMKEGLTDLTTDAATQAALKRFDLYQTQEQMKLQQLGQLQSGLTQDYGTLLDAFGRSESAMFGREGLAQAYDASTLSAMTATQKYRSDAEQRAHEFALAYQEQQEAKADEDLDKQTKGK